MVRASDISAPSDFSLEHQREDLRDRRWTRRCQVAGELAVAICKCCGVLAMCAVGVMRAVGLL